MAKPHLRDLNKERSWREKLAQQEDSGLSVREFCRRHKLSEHNFYAWRKEIRLRDQEAPPAETTFIPVEIASEEQGSEVEIRLPDQITLHLRGPVEEANLRCVLKVLGEQS